MREVVSFWIPQVVVLKSEISWGHQMELGNLQKLLFTLPIHAWTQDVKITSLHCFDLFPSYTGLC